MKKKVEPDDRPYRLQAYIYQDEIELVREAIKIRGETEGKRKPPSISEFAADAILAEAKRVIAEHKAGKKAVR